MSLFVLIDLDRVLIQNPFLFGVWPHIRNELRPLVQRNNIGEQDVDSWLMDRIYYVHGRRLAAADWVASSDWNSIVKEVADELGYKGTLDVPGLVRHYARAPYIAAYPDVTDALKVLRSRARTMWWISNGFAEYQVPVMDALGLSDYFDGYFAPDSHKGLKPYPSLFEPAIKAAQQDAQQGIMIGDSLTADVAGARLNGLYGVWLDRSLNPVFSHLQPWEIPQSKFFPAYMVQNAKSEFRADAYHIDIARDCRPHAVIQSLAQVGDVLNYWQANYGAKSGRVG